MLEQDLKAIWRDQFEDILFFETNAYAHFKMIQKHQYSELFEKYRPQVFHTYRLIRDNIALALTSEDLYIRLFAELISKTFLS